MPEQARVEKAEGLTQVAVRVWVFGEVDRREAGRILEYHLGDDVRVHSFLVDSISPEVPDFRAIINIGVSAGKLWVTLQTDKWGGWSILDDGYSVADEAPPEDLAHVVEMAVERLLQDKSPFEEAQP